MRKIEERPEDMAEEIFQKAMQGLIEKGLAEIVVIDGHKHYRATELGFAYVEYADTNPTIN